MLDSSDFVKNKQTRTEVEDPNKNYQVGENDLTCGFCAHEQNWEMMVSSNECKSVQKEKMFCVNDENEQVRRIETGNFSCSLVVLDSLVSA